MCACVEQSNNAVQLHFSKQTEDSRASHSMEWGTGDLRGVQCGIQQQMAAYVQQLSGC